MLALDGGGIRGIITLGILEQLEKVLASRSANPAQFRLCDYFDYIAGTSTGAIIAAGLARGKTVKELMDFYVETGPLMFEKPFLLQRLNSFYKGDPLMKKLKEVYGEETTLAPAGLKTLLLVVTRNETTDSPWPISSNPEALYNDPKRPDCNLKIPLWQLVRASTAAPVFFPPEVLNWDDKDPRKSFVFVDGGVTPYNNPAFLLFRFATEPAYRLN
jgi:patatin-like phospholipase/acyl hydrolase